MLNQATVEKMNRSELRTAAKQAGIKYGKMSLMQVREALVAHKPSKVEKKGERKARTGTKMQKAIALFDKSAARKDVIAKFMSEAKLTKAGAATYYALVKKKLAK
jgi:hypothetical protein